MYDLIVVGLGASGLFALANADKKLNVLGIEKNKIAGRKLNITGGGRCNITKVGDIKDFVNSYTDPSFVRPIIHAFNNEKLIEYFESRGLNTMVDGERVIPKSENAKDVTQFFLKEIEKRGHKLHFEEEIIDIKADDESIKVISKASEYECKKLIFACGGATYVETGSDGKLMKKIFDISPLEPALSPMYIEESSFDSLKGVTTNVKLNYGKMSFKGNILFTGSYLSGPVIMDISNYIQLGEKFTLDFIPKKTIDELKLEIKEKAKTDAKKLLKTVLLEISDMPESLLKLIINEVNLENVKLADLKSKDLNLLIEKLKKYTLTLKEKFPLEKAIVSKGGVKVEDIDNKTMALKKDNRIMVVGEAIELVGNCGGYNLQFAFSSAHRAIFGK